MSGHLAVKDGGLSTTLQDLGRYGYQSLGLPVSGALDPVSLRLANALVGNPDGAGAFEIRLTGPRFDVNADAVRVALVGTDSPIEIVGPHPCSIPACQSITLERGVTFRVGTVSDTACCYLAIGGGIDSPKVFGSQSTYDRGGIGGRALNAGDVVNLSSRARPAGADRRLPETGVKEGAGPIRVVLGPQADYFGAEALQTFLSSPYTVSRETDRMGMRLDGPTLNHVKGYNIPSDGIVTGAIQVPGSGQPIILLADRQTTGGYPKIGCAISADMPRLGRLRPGDEVAFAAVDAEEAILIRRRHEELLQRKIAGIESLTNPVSSLNAALLGSNLISGGEWYVDEKWCLDVNPDA